jgi:hypothetical protein
MIVVGVDYSMSCPAICIHRGTNWAFQNCKFYVLTNKKKFCSIKSPFYATLQVDFNSPEERFDNISSWAISHIPDKSHVFLEGYAFSAKGVVFQIGENTGLLKHKLWKKLKTASPTIFSPPTIKKFATQKGNANKELMHKAFVDETSIEIDKLLGCSIGDSPISDIIDAYYIAKLGFFTLIK